MEFWIARRKFAESGIFDAFQKLFSSIELLNMFVLMIIKLSCMCIDVGWLDEKIEKVSWVLDLSPSMAQLYDQTSCPPATEGNTGRKSTWSLDITADTLFSFILILVGVLLHAWFTPHAVPQSNIAFVFLTARGSPEAQASTIVTSTHGTLIAIEVLVERIATQASPSGHWSMGIDAPTVSINAIIPIVSAVFVNTASLTRLSPSLACWAMVDSCIIPNRYS